MYRFQFTTRIYELDRFAHVNNSNYLRFLEEARSKILETVRIPEIQPSEIDFQIKKIDAFFKRQVLSSEELQVISIPVFLKVNEGILRQEIRKVSDNSLCFEADIYWEFLFQNESANSSKEKFLRLFNPKFEPEVNSFKRVKFPPKGKRKRIAKKIPIQVRPYEIDRTGKLNPSVYSNYFEFGRWKFLESVNALGDIMEKDRVGLILYRSTIEISGEAVMFDQLNLHTRINELSMLKMIFYHELYSGNKNLIARGRAELCCISSSGKPIKIPAPVYEFLEKGLS